MKVILTHEQSDFDAVAALLGAWLLEDTSYPLLAGRINRNVRHFLNLYGAELPFVESRDLPAEPIENITLVDTQSLVTLKGVTAKTPVHVIDHHPLRNDLPSTWKVEIEKTGSATTVFVERLQEHLHSLTMIQATLLLLGIYEDTGAMTYSLTTARDLRAAAALIESGASLRIAAEFLNPALTEAQKELADRLLTATQSHIINGKTVLISTGDARSMRDEISSVAHKLRDLLDPDALFLLVQTSEGIRLIARSTCDEVNVAHVAAHFGGGGHDRAASALIAADHLHTGDKEISPQDLAVQLVQLLEDEIKPAVTVGKIMSKQPLLLSPATTLFEAQRLMQRYGYEGFPVVENSKVVGLLTRRSVDRAVSHHLNLTAGSLMDAGDFSLSPKDSLDTLQNLMASTGWGQIPVIDPKTNSVVGIVTRTDFLKTLQRENNFVPGKVNYAELLQKILPPLRLSLLKCVTDQATESKFPVYIVGGFVRDLILNRPSLDFDIVVEGDAIALAAQLAHHHGGRVISHRRFGTAKWMIREIKPRLTAALGYASNQSADLPDTLDLISARTEFYDHPSALPTVERSSIKLDLHRRDFTINTLALRLDGHHFGELYDYWGGLADLQKKQVKVLHSLSFVDDPTRLLRAVRFEQRFHFEIEDRTLQLMKEARPSLKQVSGDRIRHEINLILREADPAPIFARLEDLGLLTAIHPALHWREEQKQSLYTALFEDIPTEWHLPATFEHTNTHEILAMLVWLIPWAGENSVDIASRLHLTNSLQKALSCAATNWLRRETLQSLTNSEFANMLAPCPAISGLALYLCAEPGIFKEKLWEEFTRWRLISPITDGNTLKTMGLQPGPKFSQILNAVRAGWIDGIVHSPQEETDFVKKLLSE